MCSELAKHFLGNSVKYFLFARIFVRNVFANMLTLIVKSVSRMSMYDSSDSNSVNKLNLNLLLTWYSEQTISELQEYRDPRCL